jgi:hypothetical protein
LSLIGNPVTKAKEYRLYVIALLPKLKLLDFNKVKAQVHHCMLLFSSLLLASPRAYHSASQCMSSIDQERLDAVKKFGVLLGKSPADQAAAAAAMAASAARDSPVLPPFCSSWPPQISFPFLFVFFSLSLFLFSPLSYAPKTGSTTIMQTLLHSFFFFYIRSLLLLLSSDVSFFLMFHLF